MKVDKDLLMDIADDIINNLGLDKSRITFKFINKPYAMIRGLDNKLANTAGYITTVFDHHYITIYTKCDLTHIIQSLAHELRHAWQHDNGMTKIEYVYSGKRAKLLYYWKGELINYDYDTSPDEIDAMNYEHSIKIIEKWSFSNADGIKRGRRLSIIFNNGEQN